MNELIPGSESSARSGTALEVTLRLPHTKQQKQIENFLKSLNINHDFYIGQDKFLYVKLLLNTNKHYIQENLTVEEQTGNQ